MSKEPYQPTHPESFPDRTEWRRLFHQRKATQIRRVKSLPPRGEGADILYLDSDECLWYWLHDTQAWELVGQCAVDQHVIDVDHGAGPWLWDYFIHDAYTGVAGQLRTAFGKQYRTYATIAAAISDGITRFGAGGFSIGLTSSQNAANSYKYLEALDIDGAAGGEIHIYGAGKDRTIIGGPASQHQIASDEVFLYHLTLEGSAGLLLKQKTGTSGMELHAEDVRFNGPVSGDWGGCVLIDCDYLLGIVFQATDSPGKTLIVGGNLVAGNIDFRLPSGSSGWEVRGLNMSTTSRVFFDSCTFMKFDLMWGAAANGVYTFTGTNSEQIELRGRMPAPINGGQVIHVETGITVRALTVAGTFNYTTGISDVNTRFIRVQGTVVGATIIAAFDKNSSGNYLENDGGISIEGEFIDCKFILTPPSAKIKTTGASSGNVVDSGTIVSGSVGIDYAKPADHQHTASGDGGPTLQPLNYKLPAATELTIATGAVTVTRSHHTIDTEADAATDDLDTINGLVANQLYVLRPADTTRTVVLRHGVGNIQCINGANITLDDDEDFVWLLSPDGTTAFVMFDTLGAGFPGFGAVGGQIDIGDSASDGVAGTAARSDHQHAFPAPVADYPVDVGASEEDGTAITPARSDHAHAHGIIASGDHHTEYVREASAEWVDLTDGGATTLHTHAGGSNHNILSATHTDSLAASALGGDLIVANSTGIWQRTSFTNSRLLYLPTTRLFVLQHSEASAGNVGQFVVRKSRGTVGSETGISSGDIIGSYRYQGLDSGGAWGEAVNLRAVAAETFTGSAHGSKWEVYTVPIGSTTYTKVLTAESDQDVSFENDLNLNIESSTVRTPRRTISAGPFQPTTSSGAGTIQDYESATNDVNYAGTPFDSATQEYAYATIAMPPNWNGGTLTAEFYWTAASGSGGVRWGIALLSLGDDDAIDTAYGTAQEVSDTLLATGDQHKSAATAAITAGGTPAGSEELYIRVYRLPSHADDTLAADAVLKKVRLTYTTDNYEDN